MSGGPLIIGYGNTLRSDDGAGWLVADRLLESGTLGPTDVIRSHQLMPELALDVSRASIVVFVDARADVTHGAVDVRSIAPAVSRSAWSHHQTPETLLALSQELYGATPAATLVTIGAQSFEPGGELSDPVAQAMPRALEAVTEIVRAHARA